MCNYMSLLKRCTCAGLRTTLTSGPAAVEAVTADSKTESGLWGGFSVVDSLVESTVGAVRRSGVVESAPPGYELKVTDVPHNPEVRIL